MKKTPLYDLHVNLKAKLVNFGGYSMPIQYSGITIEHKCVRQDVGIFDVSHMGEFIVEGNDCLLYTSPSPRDSGKSRMPSSA